MFWAQRTMLALQGCVVLVWLLVSEKGCKFSAHSRPHCRASAVLPLHQHLSYQCCGEMVKNMRKRAWS
jgi:hypothetical protein